jgi:hypothetical protein
MTWVVWRQHRTQAIVMAGVLVGLVLLFVTSGHRLAASPSPFAGEKLARNIANLSVGIPLLLGVFFGATLFARETEQSTHVLAWTQSVTRRRWLASKLGSILLATVVWSGALTVAVTWWAHRGYDRSFENIRFDTEDLMPVAYSLFAVALGFGAGAVLRRLLPAVAVTVAGFFAVRLGVELYLRDSILRARTLLGGPDLFSSRPAGWVRSLDLLDPQGRVLGGDFRLPRECARQVTRELSDRCLADHGYRVRMVFHPASQYWPLQWIEAGMFVALAAALVGVGVWFVLRRDA